MTLKTSLRNKLQQQHPAATTKQKQHYRQSSHASSAMSSITEGLCSNVDDVTVETKGTLGTFNSPPTTTEPMIPGPGTILCFTCDPVMDNISVMDRTFEGSDSFDNLMCSSPRMFMSGSIEKLCSSFDTLCFPCSSSSSKKVKQQPPTFSPPTTDVLATTPHPQSPADSDEDLSKKMDELLKLLKEKEAASVVGGSSEEVTTPEKKASSPSSTKTVNTKSPAKTVNTNEAVLGDSGRTKKAANTAGALDETTRTSHTCIKEEEGGPLERSFVDGATTKLIGLVKSVSNSFKNLNESAISQDGSVVGIGLVPTFSGDFDDQVSQNVSVVVNNKDTLTKKTDELAFEFNSKGLSISGEQDQQQASDDAITPDYLKPPLPLVAANIKAPRQGKDKKNKKTMKINNTSTTTKSLKKITEEDIAEDKENMNPNVHWEANFSSASALDSMGFPVTATTSPSSEPVLDSMGFPIQTSSSSSQQFDDNLFAASSVCIPATAAAQTQICAWCKKSGNNEKKLKLCSACQSTYYCSSECQSKDWINGHIKTCKPCQ